MRVILGRKQVGSGSLFTGAINGHGSNWIGPIQVGLSISRVKLGMGGCWVRMGRLPNQPLSAQNRLGLGRMQVHRWIGPVFDTSIYKYYSKETCLGRTWEEQTLLKLRPKINYFFFG